LNHRGIKERVWINKSIFLGLFQLSESATSDDLYRAHKDCLPNTNMDCPVYERKWYKFWISPKSNIDKLRITLEGLR